jgi:hypothetical protein
MQGGCQANSVGILNILAALALLDAYPFIAHAGVKAGCFIGCLPQLFEIRETHRAEILLSQDDPGQFDDARPQAIQLTRGIGANQAFLFEHREEAMRCAFMQANALADIRQSQLGMGGIEAKQNIDGFLDGRGPRCNSLCSVALHSTFLYDPGRLSRRRRVPTQPGIP